jgi:carboxylesterase type B
MGITSTLAQVGCANDPDIAACLRSVPAERLASAPVSTSDLAGLHKFFYPVVDNDVLAERPIDALRGGRFAAVPLMFGTNQDEMRTLLGVHVTVPISAFGAGHGLELLVLFHDHPDLWQPTESELRLSQTMMDAWRGLADTGTVTGAVADWPSYDPATDSHLVLDTPISVGAGVRTDTCDFWDAHDLE